MKNAQKYTCPCCGYKMFDEPPGSYSICEICYWEDDPVQLKNLGSGGANINLIDAQKNYAEYGAIEKRFLADVRKPGEKDIKDPTWRMVDENKDTINSVKSGLEYFNAVADLDSEEELYYWLKNND